MTIRIVTDSTCDLPQSVIDTYHITVIPLYIHIGDKSYRDGVDLSRQDFYTRLPSLPVPPTTAVPGMNSFVEAYRGLVAEGATEILSIHISPTLSGVLNVAQAAAQEATDIPVTVVDSRQLSLGLGYTVLAAARMIAEGRSLSEVLALLADQIPRTYVFAALDTMEYLRRSGRVNHLIANVGELLRIKPLLKMNNGVATSERVRTQRRSYQRLVQLVGALGPIEQLALVHSNAADRAQALWTQARHLFAGITDPLSVDVTPLLGVHLGPGAVGFACVVHATSPQEG